MRLVVLAAAMVRLRVTLAMQVTGTAALVSQVTGAVPTSLASRAGPSLPLTTFVYVPLTLATVVPGVRRVSPLAATLVAAFAPASVLAAVAVPLRIPVVCRRCKEDTDKAFQYLWVFAPRVFWIAAVVLLPRNNKLAHGGYTPLVSGFYEVLVFIGFEKNKVSPIFKKAKLTKYLNTP